MATSKKAAEPKKKSAARKPKTDWREEIRLMLLQMRKELLQDVAQSMRAESDHLKFDIGDFYDHASSDRFTVYLQARRSATTPEGRSTSAGPLTSASWRTDEASSALRRKRDWYCLRKAVAAASWPPATSSRKRCANKGYSSCTRSLFRLSADLATHIWKHMERMCFEVK